MQYSKVDDRIMKMLKDIVEEKNVVLGKENEEVYSHDEYPFLKHLPEVTVKPSNADQVSQILALANKERIPVIPRGAGTGLCGGVVPNLGGIVISFEKMNRIKEIDKDNLMVVVEPGLPLLTLHETVEAMGLFYPPDPGEKGASLGGNISTNAGGMRAVKYGVTRDYVQGLEIALTSGERIRLGGRIVKNSSGYELLDIIIGSEGTLAVVTEATLKLIPLPPVKATIYVPFESLQAAISSCSKLLQNRILPTAIEFAQKDIITIAEKYFGKKLPHDTAEAYIIILLDGSSDEEIEKLYMRTAEVCVEQGGLDAFVASSKDDQAAIWNIRGKFLEALKSVSQFEEVDVVVPRARIFEFVGEVRRILAEREIKVVIWGHAGDGNVHVYLLREDKEVNEWRKNAYEAMKVLYQIGQAMGGRMSGEHGVGLIKKEFLVNDAPKTQLGMYRAIKRIFDPNNILNPGKVVDID